MDARRREAALIAVEASVEGAARLVEALAGVATVWNAVWTGAMGSPAAAEGAVTSFEAAVRNYEGSFPALRAAYGELLADRTRTEADDQLLYRLNNLPQSMGPAREALAGAAERIESFGRGNEPWSQLANRTAEAMRRAVVRIDAMRALRGPA